CSTLLLSRLFLSSLFFFFTHPATTHIYTLSLHDALPIFLCVERKGDAAHPPYVQKLFPVGYECAKILAEGLSLLREKRCRRSERDRKSTRLNSSHRTISYAVFCLKKKKKKKKHKYK